MRLFTILLTTAFTVSGFSQQTARFDMSLTSDGKITESVSNTQYKVESQLPACNQTGLGGKALRFDGYSNYVKANIPTATLSTEALTISMVLAAETYPMMKVDVAEAPPTYATICGNLDEGNKKGFALELSSQGDLRLRYGSATGFLMTIDGDEKLVRGTWNAITATLDKDENKATLYLNGKEIGSGRMSRTGIVHSDKDFMIGKAEDDVKSGPFLINTFCGLIDDISIANGVQTPSEFTPQAADFNYPSERYADNPWRPQMHGMPSGGWTNESHGLIYSGGRYHVFFQKNANGPYMSRLHWGHISSENLYDWTEEPIAIAPGENYDIKGCWSGCVYKDGNDTYLIYTAVDNAKATIAQAKAKDKDLREWEKLGVIINGRPNGLSDDFRDPYFFTANGEKYIIVGTNKNNIGACTLHKYENGSWTNDGSIFFQGGNANQHGSFWEMPNITPLGNGKWLFTCTPLNTGVGVRTLCWTGTIGKDGKFTPDDTGAQYLEMNGISRDGYGLLSPSIWQQDDKTLLLGIVPDKLSSEANYQMGWAHNYSLPREISIASDGTLVQKPYSGLAGSRNSETTFAKESNLNGIMSLSPVNGKQIELLGEFTLASGTCGFNFFKTDNNQASLTYDTDRGTLTLDLTNMDRTANDNGSYNGIYSAELPKKVKAGEKLKLHVYLDGSIADIFVNDTWALSVRIFPNDIKATEAEVFTSTEMKTNVKAWLLNATRTPTGITSANYSQVQDMKCYDLLGRSQSTTLRKGIYIQNGKKYVTR